MTFTHYVWTPFFVKLQIFSDFDHFTAENTQKKAKNRKKNMNFLTKNFFDKIFLKKLFQKFKSIHMGLNSFQKKNYNLMGCYYVCTLFFVFWPQIGQNQLFLTFATTGRKDGRRKGWSGRKEGVLSKLFKDIFTFLISFLDQKLCPFEVQSDPVYLVIFYSII